MDQGVVGIYSYQDSVLEAVGKLKEAGYRNMRVFSPFPSHEIEEAIAPSSPPKRVKNLTGLSGRSMASSISWLGNGEKTLMLR